MISKREEEGVEDLEGWEGERRGQVRRERKGEAVGVMMKEPSSVALRRASQQGQRRVQSLALAEDE